MKLCCRESLVLAATVVFLWISAVECAFPGGRYGAATWYYDNKLWMFGGNGWDETSTSAGLLSDMWTYDPALGMWTFIGGNKVSNVRSSSGAIGAYSATYNPGGSLNMCSWIDESTNAFWLFGGQVGLNPAAYTNAAWKYDPTLSQWAYTFNKTAVGSYGPDLYEIGPRVQHKCVSISSGVYVNGGQGYGTTKDFGYLGDLWYFNTSAPANSSWALLSGNETLDCQSTLTTDQPSSTDLPGCGTRIAGWSDNEDVYFVSGPENVNLLNQNEVYRYNPGDLSTWTSLSYIELTNRNDSGSVSKDGKAWLFGGYGFAISELRGYLADLYEWNGTNWRYLSGSKAANYLGSFPDQPGTGDSSTYPSGRRLPMMWVDNDGDLWLFGGYSALENGPLNDMWKYSMNDGIWTWMGGSKEANQNGNYTNEVIVPMRPPVPSGNVTVPSANTNDSGLSLEAKIAIGVVVPVVVIGVGLLVLLLLLKKRKKQRAKTTTTSTPLPETPAPSNSKYDAIQMKPNGVYSHIGGPNTTKPSTPSTQAVEVPVSDSRMIPYSAITLDQEIGEGSFGKVYVGKLRTTKVAIKVANTKMSQDEFIREANFQLAIPPHPNIVQLLGISIDGPQPLVILEYCNEGSLDTILFKTDKLRSPAEQIALAEAIARGIDHLHQNNIVHRDLAVRNILMHHNEPKISDFGMSRKLKEVSQVGKTAATIGPLRWMAPEALGKQVYSTKSDVWSFGMMLFEIVAHEEPHANEDLISVAIKIRDEGFVPTIPNDCPQVLREVMQLCWKVNPDERPDMNTICNFLEKTAHK